MNYLFVSDLHLGDGGPREDFLVWGPDRNGPSPDARPAAVQAMDAAFGAFLRAHRNDADEQCLVLLGDILDLWQARRPRETWRDAAFRCFREHVSAVCSLREWIGSGGRIAWILGNHDQPMCDRDAWALARELFPGLNSHAGGEPSFEFSVPAAALRAEHGHQHDPCNRFRHPLKPGADCIGHRVVRRLANPLEELVPTIDKGRTIADALGEAWRAARRDPRLWEWAVAGLRAARPGKAIRRVLDAFAAAENPLPLLCGLAGHNAGQPPANGARIFVSGHTHRRGESRGADGVHRLNPGTWRPVLGGPDAGSLEQEGGAVLVVREGREWRAQLAGWQVSHGR